MTLQNLLPQREQNFETKQVQAQKTAQLIAKQKEAAQKILLGALAHLESSSSTSEEVSKKIWI